MFITKKKHDQIVRELQARLDDREYLARTLEIMADKIGIPKPEYEICSGSILTMSDRSGIHWSNNISNIFPDEVAQYVDDYFGGKVIKQEATKVIEISRDGVVSEHLTKMKSDKGYSYKLIRK